MSVQSAKVSAPKFGFGSKGVGNCPPLSSSLPCHPIGLYSDPRAVIVQAALDSLFPVQLVYDSHVHGMKQ